MRINNRFTELTGIAFPMILAPMFLVSNEAMMKAGMKAGILSVFPSLNFREKGELDGVLDNLNALLPQSNGSYGVNLIVQKSNPLYEKHLAVCVAKKVPFYITSLGNPQQVIEAAHAYGAKVFCDVTNMKHAKKVAGLGCDGFIAVGAGAGGHAGPFPLHILVDTLRLAFPGIPVIGAGGVASGAAVAGVLAAGAEGVSVGTRFIASVEAGVNEAYKNAVVDAGMEDIVMTTQLSGTPCTVIDSPDVQKLGFKQSWLQRMLSKNKTIRKYFKMGLQLRGFKKLEDSARSSSYGKIWCAGQSVEMVKEVQSVAQIVEDMKGEATTAIQRLQAMQKG